MKKKLTPMKKQYLEIKREHPDALLFFRLGDFYELFDEDAIIASRELEITLTSRDRGVPEEEQTPMCGVPFHSVEPYIAKLIEKGYKVAVCEQTEDPKFAKGIVQREVIRTISAGTLMEDGMLTEGRNNYLAALLQEEESLELAVCEFSRGEFLLYSFNKDEVQSLINTIVSLSPSELLLHPSALELDALREFIKAQSIYCSLRDKSLGKDAECAFFEHFSDKDDLGEKKKALPPASLKAALLLTDYIIETQKSLPKTLDFPKLVDKGLYMELGFEARRALELTESMSREKGSKSLLKVLDRTRTAMGKRLFRTWVERPLLDIFLISERQNAVEELFCESRIREEIRLALKDVSDLERLTTRINMKSAGPYDLLALGRSSEPIGRIKALCQGLSARRLREISLLSTLNEIAELIGRSIDENAPNNLRDGGVIKKGYSEEVDRLRGIKQNSAKLLRDLEQREREKLGIKKLKLGYNRVFGYYIDIPNSARDKELPEEYIRKQTLVSSERYFTPELKELEGEILGASERALALEQELFSDLLSKISERTEEIIDTAGKIALLDSLCSLAAVASENGYVRPQIEPQTGIYIREGRHPVVELTLEDEIFVPNDVNLNKNCRLALITGPNMAGKSTYMRMTALIVLMAQMGSFVPAAECRLGIVDRVFTRIGASDDITRGKSTFMVEMSEVAEILENATERSLLILDEVGRGTSTYDGMAIARALIEHCAEKRRLGALTMFSTHYHELTALEGKVEGLKNYSLRAMKEGGKLRFMRRVIEGPADESYGIEVAKLAGVRESLIRSAKKYLEELESGSFREEAFAASANEDTQLSLTDLRERKLIDKLKILELEKMTPLEAMNILSELKKEAEF